MERALGWGAWGRFSRLARGRSAGAGVRRSNTGGHGKKAAGVDLELDIHESARDILALMAEAALRMRMTEEEYLAFERASDERHEYADGEIFAMAGGTSSHNAVTVSIGTELRVALRGRRCRSYSPDMRIYIPLTQRYVYADASVACGPIEFKDATNDTLLNPKVIVEVLSPSTERYDRGDKFALYRSIPSVTNYVLAAQDKPLLEVFTRQENGFWSYRAYGPGEKAVLSAIGCELDVDMVYTDVFDESLEQAGEAS